MMKNKIFSFGDSWSYGYGLKSRKVAFPYLVATKLGYSIKNQSEPSAAFGVVFHNFMQSLNEITPNDIILVTVPPDTRWFYINAANRAISIVNTNEDYEIFLKLIDYSSNWFTNMHCLFLHHMILQAEHRKLTIYFQHNYGDVVLEGPYQNQNIEDYFIDFNQSMCDWLNLKQDWNNYSVENDGPPLHDNTNHLMIPNDNHPNELGHQLIADKIAYELKKRMGSS